MNHLQYVFTPAQTASLSGISVTLLRDWRRRDLVSRVGEQQANGRWIYCLKDVIHLAIVKFALLNIPVVPIAFHIADRALFSVITNATGQSDPGFAFKYLLIWADPAWLDREFVSSLRIVGTDDLDSIGAAPAATATFVNTQKLTNSLNPMLLNVIRHGLSIDGSAGIFVPESGH